MGLLLLSLLCWPESCLITTEIVFWVILDVFQQKLHSPENAKCLMEKKRRQISFLRYVLTDTAGVLEK